MVNPLREEKGSALIIAILVVGLLAVIAISATQITKTETRISRNDKLYKTTFFQADSGVEMGIILVEANIELRGFTCTGPSDCAYQNVGITPASYRFYLNSGLDASTRPCDPDCGSCPTCTAAGSRDAFYSIPAGGQTPCPQTTNCLPTTHLKFGGNTSLSTGGAIQMIAGYEGKGKSSAGGGGWITYDIRSRNQGLDSSETTINGRWRHVM